MAPMSFSLLFLWVWLIIFLLGGELDPNLLNHFMTQFYCVYSFIVCSGLQFVD